jgi:transmembrane sensor
MSASGHHRSSKIDGIADQAALWLARRDRGLSAEEQDAYMQWLTADPRHAEELARHAAAFQRMMRLYEWQPGQSSDPNPDLFAPRRPWKIRFWWLSVAAAAMLAISAAIFWSRLAPSTSTPSSYLRLNESKVLPDGSIVELKDGSAIELMFSSEVRGVRLKGEAHFTVAKSAKPFVVEAGNVAVRAVGTAFNVRLDQNEVDVLVTEGRVHVNRAAAATSPITEPDAADGLSAVAATAVPAGAVLTAGQRATVSMTGDERPRVSDATPAEIERVLSWQAPRLQFSETPLAVAISEFNQRNRTRLVLGEPELADIPIGGTFRVDNVEGFIRLLEVTLDIRAETRAGGKIILSRRR